MNQNSPPLIAILRQLLEEINSLQSLLEQENQALSKGHHLELESIANRKHEAVQRISLLNERRDQALQSEPAELREAGLGQSLETASIDDPELREIHDYWLTINQSLEQCKRLNESNGASIELMNRQTMRMIDLLRNPTKQPTTYGPDGNREQVAVSSNRVSV